MAPIPIPILAVLAALLAASSTPLETESWARVRSPDLHGRRVGVREHYRSATRLLGGADPARDGVWVPLRGARAEDVKVVPAPPHPPLVEVVEVPAALRGRWILVPLPLGAWDATSLAQVSSFAITEGRSGPRAGSVRVPGAERPAVACEPAPAGAPVLPARIADFEGGPLEPLGNRYGTYAGRGASASGSRVRDARGARLVMDVKSSAGGYGGLWIELAPALQLADPRHGVDLSGLAEVVVRGRGVPRGTVRLSDTSAASRDKGVLVGTLSGEADRDGGWMRRLPLPETPLDLRRLRALTIDLSGAGGRLELDEVVLLGAGQEAPPAHRAAATTPTPGARGTWVWHTRELLGAPAQEAQLLERARSWRLTEVYLQLPHPEGAGSLASWRRARELAGLVARLHAAGLRVHALDGAPWMALPEAQGELLDLAASVADWNAARPAAERFDALHLDVEPYLLPRFGGPRRGELLRAFAGLLPRLKAAAKVPLWLDVPFWYDSADRPTTVEDGEEPGCAKPRFLEEALDAVDGLGIMAYRTRADGSDGIAALALGELRRAHARGREVRVGVETIRLRDEEAWHVDLAPTAEPRVGRPAVALPGDEAGYVLFTRAYGADDAGRLQAALPGARVMAAVHERGAASTKISFHGRPREEVEATVAEVLELLHRAGLPAGGVAFHEARTLP